MTWVVLMGLLAFAPRVSANLNTGPVVAAYRVTVGRFTWGYLPSTSEMLFLNILMSWGFPFFAQPSIRSSKLRLLWKVLSVCRRIHWGRCRYRRIKESFVRLGMIPPEIWFKKLVYWQGGHLALAYLNCLKAYTRAMSASISAMV